MYLKYHDTNVLDMSLFELIEEATNFFKVSPELIRIYTETDFLNRPIIVLETL